MDPDPPVHASDFFHGTLELVEDGVSVMLLKGEDAAPPARRTRREVRAARTATRCSCSTPPSWSCPGIVAELRSLISPVAARHGARAGQRPPRGQARPPADHPALLQARGLLSGHASVVPGAERHPPRSCSPSATTCVDRYPAARGSCTPGATRSTSRCTPRRRGAHAAYLGAVGTDRAGRGRARSLRAEGVDTSLERVWKAQRVGRRAGGRRQPGLRRGLTRALRLPLEDGRSDRGLRLRRRAHR